MIDINLKQHLREKMKALRAEKAPEFSDAASQAKDIFLSLFSNFTKIALYCPMRDEL